MTNYPQTPDPRDDGRERQSPSTNLKRSIEATLQAVSAEVGFTITLPDRSATWSTPSAKHFVDRLAKFLKIQLSLDEVRGCAQREDLINLLAAKLSNGSQGLSSASMPNARAPASPIPAPIARTTEYTPTSVDDIAPHARIGRYRIAGFIGRGAFSHVYVGQAIDTGEKVALKVPSREGGGRVTTRLIAISPQRTREGISPDELPAEAIFWGRDGLTIDALGRSDISTLLRAEAIRLESSDGGALPRLIEQLEFDDGIALVMEYISGRTLREKLREGHEIHINWFLQLAKDCRAIGGHGDLKPENIVIRHSGLPRLIDPMVETNVSGQRVTTQTPHYNPFLAEGTRADTYAIGIMIYEVLTGTLPFDEVPWQFAGRKATSEMHQLDRSLFLSYPPPELLNPRTPDAMRRMVYNCLTVPRYDLPNFIDDCQEFIKS